jgi:hypothetical protein
MVAEQQNLQKPQRQELPIAKNEDVEYSSKLADEDDVEAVERAEAADTRQQT